VTANLVKKQRLASRPDVPGYFLPRDEGSGLLPWEAAVERLIAARNYWVASSSAAGIPHSMPVWGVWRDDHFLFSTGPTTRKARNLIENPFAVVHLESGAELVVVEGVVRQVSNEDVVGDFLSAYNPKYNWNFTADDFRSGGLFEVEPRRAFAWLGDEGEAFSGTATRWVFETPEG
jgi:hypothetical protein